MSCCPGATAPTAWQPGNGQWIPRIAMAISECPDNFAEFLLWERSSRDSIEVKRLYIDLAGDLVAGVVLSQVIYWHLPNREGKARLQVKRAGNRWLAKGREEWWGECRISPKQADRALRLLEERGLIEVKLFKFGNAPKKHIRILQASFLQAWRTLVLSTQDARTRTRPVGARSPGAAGGPIPPVGHNRPVPSGKDLDFDAWSKSIDTEITTKTSAASSASEAEPDSAAALAGELVGHGVSRTVANRLARDKPDACRRCLEYLPFAQVRTTAGAWLANAIRDDYGPPAGFAAQGARAARQLKAEHTARVRAAQVALERTVRDADQARLRVAYRAMVQTGGDEYRDFLRFVDQERARTDRIALHLSAERRSQLLAAFDRPDRRVELFERWLNTDAAGPCRPPRPQADCPVEQAADL